MKISCCRMCKNENLVSLLHLGNQTLTGVFPKSKTEIITSGPLELVKCHPKHKGDSVCHLVQLNHSYNNDEMYGLNYGYRSGLNASMVEHLQSIVKGILHYIPLKKGDLVIDIGSNDSTLLQTYPASKGLILTGIDPTGKKFKKYYPKHIQLIPDFFSFKAVNNHFPGKKAKVITSIAMFYDLEEPLEFVKQIFDSLHDEGIWVFEQSYISSFLKTNSYDTICHEHLEYYGISQVKWLMDKVGFKIIDVKLNEVNGGSFRVTVAKKTSSHKSKSSVSKLFKEEEVLQLHTLKPYRVFQKNVTKHRKTLITLIAKLKRQGKTIYGYGASTKGNVILQYCGLGKTDIPFIAEVNEDKFGAFTPFTHIPIISEKEARNLKPDYFLVLPWHFRKGILKRESEFLKAGGKFIFPLPEIQIVGK